MLEVEADEKYYLKNATYEWYQKHNKECEEKGLGFRFEPIERERAEVAKTLTTKPDRTESNYVQEL